MTSCEMCGKETNLLRALIEGTEMQVCEKCGAFGQILKKPNMQMMSKHAQKTIIEEPNEVLVSDFGKKIHEAREKKGMTQKEFAHLLNEKESIIHKIENESFHPAIPTARKIEKILKLTLVEFEKSETMKAQKGKSHVLTIGDLIKVG